MSILQCMGGLCSSRENCAHYHAPKITGHQPSERLCGPTEEPVSVKWAQDRERLAADPRFGQWAAGMQHAIEQSECER